MDGTKHTHSHPAEVLNHGNDQSGGNAEQGEQGEDHATSYAEALKEGVKDGHVHPSNVEEHDKGDKASGGEPEHPSYAEVAAPE